MRHYTLAFALAASLSTPPAAAQSGEALSLFVRPDKGNCLACHQLPEGAGPRTRANVGPLLDGARLKGWDRERLRALLEDPMRSDPGTVMPPYGRHAILEAREIGLLVEFLRALP